MSQNTVILPTTGTVSGLQMTQNVNNALDTLNTLWSGATAPTSTEAGQWWHDTTNNILKIRSLDNTAWISLTNLCESAYLSSPVYSSQMSGNLNRILNGGMMIDQVNEGSGYAIAATNTPTYTLDQWVATCSSGSASGITVQRVTDAPAGFTNSLRATVGTGAGSVGSGDFLFIYQPIEANNLTDWNYGTASAISTSLSFWVKSSVSGNFAAVLQNAAGNRNSVFKFTIATAGVWQFVTIPNIAGDQSGTWAAGNSAMLNLCICIAAGSSLQTAALGTWQSGAYCASSTQNNSVLTTSGATFQLTGVMLNPGAFSLPFEKRLFPYELQACERYFEKSYDLGTAPGTVTANGNESVVAASTTVQFNVRFKVAKRASPSIATYSPVTGTSGNFRNATTSTDVASSLAYIGLKGCTVYNTSAATTQQYILQWTSSARM